MYTIEFKKEVVKYAKKHSVAEAVYRYKIAYTTIRGWLKNKQKLEKPSNESNMKNISKLSKAEVLEYAKLKSVAAAARKYRVSATTIHNWLKEPVPVVDVDIKQQLKTLFETVLYKAIDAL